MTLYGVLSVVYTIVLSAGSSGLPAQLEAARAAHESRVERAQEEARLMSAIRPYRCEAGAHLVESGPVPLPVRPAPPARPKLALVPHVPGATVSVSGS